MCLRMPRESPRLKRTDAEERERLPGSGPGGEAPGRGQRIRCPKCGYQPRPKDRWGCLCGCWWNTFDTRGQCPDCGRQWRDTQCLRCGEWSPHEDWYEPAEGDPHR